MPTCPWLISTPPLLALEQHSVQEAMLGDRQVVSTLLTSEDESSTSPLPESSFVCWNTISLASRMAFMHAVRTSCWDWHCASHGEASLFVLFAVMIERISNSTGYRRCSCRVGRLVHKMKNTKKINEKNDFWEFIIIISIDRTDLSRSHQQMNFAWMELGHVWPSINRKR